MGQKRAVREQILEKGICKGGIAGPLGALEYCKTQHGDDVDLFDFLWWSIGSKSSCRWVMQGIFDHSYADVVGDNDDAQTGQGSERSSWHPNGLALADVSFGEVVVTER